tara:strand:- start:508 stop:963 length:456 start_codon:yes stop_codon:yes gene_type:complete
LTLTICFGCSEKNTEWKSEKNATIFFGSKTKIEKFTLTFNKTDKSLDYKYVNQIDTSKTISIRKSIDSDSLLFGFEKFKKTNKEPFKNNKFNGLEFDYYDLVNPVADGTGPILFNSKYGILAINNVFGPTIIFLDKKDNILTEQIINKMNE